MAQSLEITAFQAFLQIKNCHPSSTFLDLQGEKCYKIITAQNCKN
jgi:hypothetical protein|nr:MAG TPA: hypothetical protein [Caudoviricetes sp.]